MSTAACTSGSANVASVRRRARPSGVSAACSAGTGPTSTDSSRPQTSAAIAPRRASVSGLAMSRRIASFSIPIRIEVSSALTEFELASAEDGREHLATMAAALRFNNLKIAASEMAPRVCQGALGVCGIMGYKNDTPFSVGRHLRDTMSACLMVANERIHHTNASLLLIAKDV